MLVVSQIDNSDLHFIYRYFIWRPLYFFFNYQADRLKVLFDALPKNMEPLDISAVAAKWG